MSRRSGLLTVWAICIAVALVFVLFLLRKSAFYHADTTWQLYSIWSVMQPGHAPDFLSSLRPGYLLNVPAMWCFGVNLYALRVVTYCLAVLALAVFVYGLRRELLTSPWFPVIVLLASVCQLRFSDYIFSYYNAPWVFLALGLGLFWWSGRLQTLLVWCLAGLAGVALAIASLSNLALLPAGVLAIFVVLWAAPRRQTFICILATVLTWVLVGGWYFDVLGVAHQLLVEHARSTHGLFDTVLVQARKAMINLMVLVAAVLLSWVAWYFSIRRVAMQTPAYGRRYLYFSVLIALAFFWLLQAIIDQGSAQYNTLAVYFFMVLWAALSWVCFWPKHAPGPRRILNSSLLIVLLFIFDHGATTQNPYFAVFALYIPLLVVLLMVWVFSHPCQVSLWQRRVIAAVVCVMFVYPLWVQDSTILAKGFLTENQYVNPFGAEVTAHEMRLIQHAQQLYQRYDCKNKWFFAFYDETKWYVIFRRHAPFDQSWVSRVHFYPRNRAITAANIVSVLRHQPSWCVIYGADHGWYAKGIPAKNLQPVVDYLKHHSAVRAVLGKDVADNQTVLHFWVKE